MPGLRLKCDFIASQDLQIMRDMWTVYMKPGVM